VLWSLKNSLK